MRVWRGLTWLVLLLGLSHPVAAQKDEAAYHFTVARLLAGEGRGDEAVREYERAVELDPEAAALRAEYAEVLFDLRRARAAVEQIDRAFELDGDDPDVLRLYGRIHYSIAGRDRDSLARAETAFERLRELDPRDISSMLTLAQLYEGTGRIDQAIEVVREVVANNPDNRQLNRILVEILRQAGRSAEAEQVLQEILELDNEALQSRLELAEIESGRGHFGRAIEILESAGPEIAVHPQLRRALAESYLRRALSPGLQATQRRADLERARSLVTELKDESPEDAALDLLLSEILWEQGEEDEALRRLREGRDKRPDNAWLAVRLAGRLEETGRPAEAADVLRQALKSSDADGDARQLLEEQLFGVEIRREQWPEVVKLGEELLVDREPGPERREIFSYYLEALVETDRSTEALAAIRAERERAGSSNALVLAEAGVLARSDRSAKARRVLAGLDLVEIAPPDVFRLGQLVDRLEGSQSLLDDAGPLLAFRIGQAFSYRSEYERALPLLERAAVPSEEIPASLRAESWFWLGQAQERTGAYDAAATSFERVLELEPDNADAMNYLGYMWADLGRNLERALALTTRAVATEPENAAFIDSLGWALYRLGRYEEALDQLERAAGLLPEDSTILEHLGDVYVALGRVEDAREVYQQALELNDEENLEAVRRKLSGLSEL